MTQDQSQPIDYHTRAELCACVAVIETMFPAKSTTETLQVCGESSIADCAGLDDVSPNIGGAMRGALLG